MPANPDQPERAPADPPPDAGTLPYARQQPKTLGKRVPLVQRVIEYVVAGLIIAFVVCALVPSFSTAVPFGYIDPVKHCQGNLRFIGMGMQVYAEDHAGALPPDLLTLLLAGQTTTDSLHCRARQTRETDPFDYHYVTGLRTTDPNDWILAFDDAANHGGTHGHVLYLDGRVEWLTMKELNTELARFNRAYTAARGEPPKILGREQPYDWQSILSPPTGQGEP